MHTLDAQSLLALAVPAVGVIVWLVRLEGRINVNEQMQKEMKEDVQYIRTRIDTFLAVKR